MNASNSSTIDPIYSKYHGVGFSPSLVLNFTPTFIISIIAILLNSSLIYLAIKFRSSLYGPFNLMIAFESFGAALYEFSYIIRFPIPLFGINYIRADPICFILQFPLAFGMEIQFVSMFGIGIERLLCVLFPIWFKMASKNLLKYFIYFVIFIGIICGIYGYFCLYKDIFAELKGKEIMCALGDGQGSNFRAFQLNKYLIWTSAFIYIGIWLIMLKAIIQKRKVLNTYNLHILKSISAIMLVIILGWMIQYFGPYYSTFIVISPEALFIYAARMVDIMIIAGAMNAPILFTFSKEYRKYFTKIFPFLRWNCKVNPAIPNVQIAQQNNNPLATVSK